MTNYGDLILSEAQIQQKLKRIAFQIVENNIKEPKLIIAGINGQGYLLAKKLTKTLEAICSSKLTLVEVQIDKKSPSSDTIGLNCDEKAIKDQSVILVDDVLNTGKTMAYSIIPFLRVSVKKLEVAVLVNRDHNRYPLRATYTGYELSTTLQNHIEVNLGLKKMAVFLH